MTDDSHKSAEEFNLVIPIYQPDFSDLYRLAHKLIDEDQTKHWMKLARREHSEGNLEKLLTFFFSFLVSNLYLQHGA